MYITVLCTLIPLCPHTFPLVVFYIPQNQNKEKEIFKYVAPFSMEGEVVCLRQFMPILKEENSYVIMYAFVVLFTFL